MIFFLRSLSSFRRTFLDISISKVQAQRSQTSGLTPPDTMATTDAPSVDVKLDDTIEHLEKPGQEDSHGHIEGNALLVAKDGQVRKIPIPSSDPNDPLNFRKWEKYGIVFCCCWFSIMGLSMASGLGAILNTFFDMYAPQGYSPDQIVFLITMPTLCIGLGTWHSHSV